MSRHYNLPMKSLSIFVGTGACNANCAHCAGQQHRRFCPKKDGVVDKRLIRKTLEECAKKGAMRLSITSAGEPTLSPVAVTKLLQLVDKLQVYYSPINLYTNGLRIATDSDFCSEYLPKWREFGLTTIYLTVHSTDLKQNAAAYGVPIYPDLGLLVTRLHRYKLGVRANLVLNRNLVGTFDQFKAEVNNLRVLGFDSVAAWGLRDEQDQLDASKSPPEAEFDQMESWALCARYPIVVYRESKRNYNLGDKLTLFPDGTLSSEWCK